MFISLPCPRPLLALALLCLPGLASAGLGYDEALRLAVEQAPSLQAQRSTLAGAQAARPAAGTLPDPRLTLGVDNLPISGPDRFSLGRDFMTMQRIGLMQEVPNRAKREARVAAAQARVERDAALLAAGRQAVRREAALAWLAVQAAQARLARLADLERENRMLLDTLAPRIAAGRAMPAERTMARQEALALADRRDEAERDLARSRATLRRHVGSRADEPLEGDAPPLPLQPEALRGEMHRHAEIAPFAAMRAMAEAEAGEMAAEQRGDWAWELAYSRRGAQWGDMVSFQVSLDLPWQRAQRQQPQLAARQQEVARIEAEREDMVRRHREEIDGQLAELQALDAQRERLVAQGQPLAAERVALALAAYQSGRGDLAAVLAARRDELETRLRLIDLDAQRSALRVRLTTLALEP